MPRRDPIDRYLRPLVVVAGVVPGCVIASRLLRGDYVNPAEALEHATGLTALWLLLGSLMATPLRRLTGRPGWTRLRRPLGLWAFGYALIHLCCYLVFDQSLLWREIGGDILERPYITVGFAAFVLLLLLALTSPERVMRRLGGARWRRLHQAVYWAAVLAVFHFFWLVKRDITAPFLAAMTLLLLLLLRRPPSAARSRSPARDPAASRLGSVA